VSAAQPEEKARSSRKAIAKPPRVFVAGLGARVEVGALGQREGAGGGPEPAVQAIPMTPNMNIGRDGEERPGLANTAQVHRGEQRRR
jgi:hypothetical protein